MIRIDRLPVKYPKSPLGPKVVWAHMWSDTNDADELHRWAEGFGLKRSWFQDKPGFPHYDVAGSKRHQAAVQLGAVPSSLRDWVAKNMPAGREP